MAWPHSVSGFAALSKQCQSQQFRGNIEGLLSGLCLYTVDLWLWRSVFDFCRKRFSEAGRKWGEWSETWPGQGPFVGDLNLSSLFTLPIPARPFSCSADKRGIMCFSLVGCIHEDLHSKAGVWSIKVWFKSIDLFVWLPLATDKSKHHHILVRSMCVSASW